MAKPINCNNCGGLLEDKPPGLKVQLSCSAKESVLEYISRTLLERFHLFSEIKSRELFLLLYPQELLKIQRLLSKDDSWWADKFNGNFFVYACHRCYSEWPIEMNWKYCSTEETSKDDSSRAA